MKKLSFGVKCKKKYLKQMKKHSKKKIKVYISGAISKDPNHFLNFENAERILRENGFEPLNPCKTVEYTLGLSNYECFCASVRLLLKADIIVQISDIKTSLGMQIENELSERLNIPIQNWILDNKGIK
jgi:hypothetical protein